MLWSCWGDLRILGAARPQDPAKTLVRGTRVFPATWVLGLFTHFIDKDIGLWVSLCSEGSGPRISRFTVLGEEAPGAEDHTRLPQPPRPAEPGRESRRAQEVLAHAEPHVYTHGTAGSSSPQAATALLRHPPPTSFHSCQCPGRKPGPPAGFCPVTLGTKEALRPPGLTGLLQEHAQDFGKAPQL